MKVYAVISRCDDDYYPDYTVVDDRVYLKEEDAEKIWKKLDWPEQYKVYIFEVIE